MISPSVCSNFLATSLTISLSKTVRSSVGLDKIFHKLRVLEVDSARIVLIHSGNLSHFFRRQFEVEDVEALSHSLLMARLGNGHNAALRQPAESHLCGTKNTP